MSKDTIFFFGGEYDWLSNMSAYAIAWEVGKRVDRKEGYVYPTVEHAYQFSKFKSVYHGCVIREATSPFAAKELAHLPEVQALKREDWCAELKLQIMSELIWLKIEQHPRIQHKLIKTGTRELVEANPNDPFWGYGPDRKGKNHLGRIWMEHRTALQFRGALAGPVTA